MAQEMLGIMVTRHDYLEQISGIALAAVKSGRKVSIFLTDEGVRFTRDPGFLKLLKLNGVAVACCDYNCELMGLHERTEGIVYGSQYDNAGMFHNSGRVLVF